MLASGPYHMHCCCRGLETVLIEREDFGSGTSSRSTKLIHGGVRYLQKAVFNLDRGQLQLVFEALRERFLMLRTAPHLTNALPILTVGCRPQYGLTSRLFALYGQFSA